MKTNSFKPGLIIFAIVSVFISAITLYFTMRELTNVKHYNFYIIESELNHLARTARESIGVDELAIMSAIHELKKNGSIAYAYVLDAESRVIQCFDRRRKIDAMRVMGRPVPDSVARKLSNRQAGSGVMVISHKDMGNGDKEGYDFSMPVYSKFDNRRIGSVIIGLSDRSLARKYAEVIRMSVAILIIFLMTALALSMAAGQFIVKDNSDDNCW